MHPGHGADPPDGAFEGLPLVRPEVSGTEAQEALHDLQVVLHPVIDLAQQHFALGGGLALLDKRVLGRREEPRIEFPKGTGGRQALVADPALHDVVEQEDGEDARQGEAQRAGRHDGPGRALGERIHPLVIGRRDAEPPGQGRALEAGEDRLVLEIVDPEQAR